MGLLVMNVNCGCIIFISRIKEFPQKFLILGLVIIRTHGNASQFFIYSFLNFSPMVITDVAQLSRECNAWRETLRSYRDEFGSFKNRLQEVAGRQVEREALLEVEHLDNQFHIQLINIHDLKQAIKVHSRKVNSEMAGTERQLADDTLADHEHLYDDYQSLENTLHDLRHEFDDFVSRAR